MSEAGSQQRPVEIYVTGYGPFANIVHNPTGYILRHLEDFVAHADGSPLPPCTGITTEIPLPSRHAPSSASDVVTLPPNVHIRSRTILEVSATAVHAYTAAAHESAVAADAEAEEGAATPVRLHLHFGVYDGIKRFHVEAWGYNHADFRVPDWSNCVVLPGGALLDIGSRTIAAGPDGRPFSHEEEAAYIQCLHAAADDNPMHRDFCVLSSGLRGACDTRLASTVDTGALVAALTAVAEDDAADGTDTARETFPACAETNDPGSYLCNYVYYCSLFRTAANTTLALAPSCGGDAGGNVGAGTAAVYADGGRGACCFGPAAASTVQRTHALFVHVPSFHDVAERPQLRFAAALLGAVAAALPEAAAGEAAAASGETASASGRPRTRLTAAGRLPVPPEPRNEADAGLNLDHVSAAE